MDLFSRESKYYYLSFFKHDFKSSITVFFVALPLCLGISLASNAPLYSGLISGIIGGIVVSLISKSQLSVSGPAAGLTAITAVAISTLGGIESFFLAVSVAGLFQIILGAFRLGGFTHFIPSAVIKGMLTGIGLILVSKQIPFLLGYDKPHFWTNELFNIITFHNSLQQLNSFYQNTTASVILLSAVSFLLLIFWKKYLSRKTPFLPASFVTVVMVSILTGFLNKYVPALKLNDSQFVAIPHDIFTQIKFPDFNKFFTDLEIWKYAVIICMVTSIETLLSVEAIDKLDPYNRLTPQNRELMAQGTGNLLSGLLCGLPITAVIVRSSANAEAGARTKLSAITHGLWLMLAVFIGIPVINNIPYCVLAVILIRTGYNLVKPKMVKAVYNQGKEQFMPFMVTVVAILFTDLLIGVTIGIVFALYFLIKHTYRAGFIVSEKFTGHTTHYTIELALNVSFLNKNRVATLLDSIPKYSIVEIIGTDSIYIDHDVLEIFHDYKTKAIQKHIQLILKNIPDTETIELH